MAKVTLTTLANLENESTAVNTINLNFTEIQEVIETLLSRDGTAPNSMLASIDMNSNRILNLPAPTSNAEPARHGDINQYVVAAQNAQTAAETAQNLAEIARDASQTAQGLAETAQAGAETAETNVEAALAAFNAKFPGSLESAPDVTPGIGEDILDFEGTLYYDETLDAWRIYVAEPIYSNGDEVLVGTDAVVIAEFRILPTTTLASMTDVDYTGVTDGQYLRWVAANNRFEPATLAAVASLFEVVVACSDETTELTTGTAVVTFRCPRDITVTGIKGSLTTASTSGAITVDVNNGGVSVFSTELTIDQDETTSATAATPAVISDTTWSEDDEITIDIDGAGSGAAGLKVTVVGTRVV